jgi:hypothetical protein
MAEGPGHVRRLHAFLARRDDRPTFFHLDPFLAHGGAFFVYWLANVGVVPLLHRDELPPGAGRLVFFAVLLAALG